MEEKLEEGQPTNTHIHPSEPGPSTIELPTISTSVTEPLDKNIRMNALAYRQRKRRIQSQLQESQKELMTFLKDHEILSSKANPTLNVIDNNRQLSNFWGNSNGLISEQSDKNLLKSGNSGHHPKTKLPDKNEDGFEPEKNAAEQNAVGTLYLNNEKGDIQLIDDPFHVQNSSGQQTSSKERMSSKNLNNEGSADSDDISILFIAKSATYLPQRIQKRVECVNAKCIDITKADQAGPSCNAGASIATRREDPISAWSSSSSADALRQRAIDVLKKEAKRSAQRAEHVGPQGWVKPRSLTTNKMFIGNLLRSAELSQRDAVNEGAERRARLAPMANQIQDEKKKSRRGEQASSERSTRR